MGSSHYCLKPISRENTNHKIADTSKASRDGSSDESSDETPSAAPVELKAEFVQCLQSKDWANALKLCKMILIYEPENPTASEYITVLEERIQIEEEATTEDETSSDDESSDSEETSEDESSGDENESESGADEQPDLPSDVVISIKK